MGHSEDDAVHKIPQKMKTHWQNNLKFSVLVWFTIFYRTRYKKIDVRLVQCPFNFKYWYISKINRTTGPSHNKTEPPRMSPVRTWGLAVKLIPGPELCKLRLPYCNLNSQELYFTKLEIITVLSALKFRKNGKLTVTTVNIKFTNSRQFNFANLVPGTKFVKLNCLRINWFYSTQGSTSWRSLTLSSMAGGAETIA